MSKTLNNLLLPFERVNLNSYLSNYLNLTCKSNIITNDLFSVAKLTPYYNEYYQIHVISYKKFVSM